MATMDNRTCNVPIDLDEENNGLCFDISRDLIGKAISTAISLKHDKSAWSSSSGSCYDEDEPTTSPIDLGGKWYWNSPRNSMSSESDSSSTHDSGYLSRSNSLDKRKEGLKIEIHPTSRVCSPSPIFDHGRVTDPS